MGVGLQKKWGQGRLWDFREGTWAALRTREAERSLGMSLNVPSGLKKSLYSPPVSVFSYFSSWEINYFFSFYKLSFDHLRMCFSRRVICYFSLDLGKIECPSFTTFMLAINICVLAFLKITKSWKRIKIELSKRCALTMIPQEVRLHPTAWILLFHIHPWSTSQHSSPELQFCHHSTTK